jgi:hypothetical protein
MSIQVKQKLNKEIKDKKLAEYVEKNPICKDRFEALLKKAADKPASKRSKT